MYLELENLSGGRLRGEVERVGAAIRALSEGFFGAQAGKLGVVIRLAQVGEDEDVRRAVVAVEKKLGGGAVREVPVAAHQPLFEVPGVGADLEHVEIVVRLEDQQVAAAHVLLDELGDIAQVGDNADFDALGGKRKCHGVGGVVGNGEG